MRRCWVVAGVLVGLLAAAWGQDSTLAGALDRLPDDRPVIAPEPGGRRASKPSPSLADFGLRFGDVGGLRAVYPSKMVRSLSPERALVDPLQGLPRGTRVLLLLSRLDERGRRLLTGAKGIGMGDLDREGQAILRSLIGPRLSFREIRPPDAEPPPRRTEDQQLSPEDLPRVRLRLERMLSLHVEQEEGGSSSFGTLNVPTAGRTLLERVDERFETPDLFGQMVTETVPSEPKPSDPLPESLLRAAPVGLRTGMTLREALATLEVGAGVRLHADLRVADRKLWVKGGPFARADALRAIGLLVGGAWRRVGGTLHLAPEREGQAVTQLKWAQWASQMSERVDGERSRILARLRTDDAIRRVPVRDDRFVPNPTMARAIEQIELGERESESIPTSQLTPAIREILKQNQTMYRLQRWKLDAVKLEPELRFRFILPDGRPLQPELYPVLYGWAELKSTAVRRAPETVPETRRGSLKSPARLVVRPTDPSEARAWVALARRKGFLALAVETRRPEVLAAALEAAEPAKLPITWRWDPWEAPPGAIFDRTLLGEDREQATRRALTQGLGHELRPPSLPGAVAPTVPTGFAPLLPRLASITLTRWAPYPPSPKNPPERVPLRRLELGYEAGLREAALDRWGADPADFGASIEALQGDLRIPRFPDDELRGSYSTYDGRDPVPAGYQKAKESWRKELNDQSIARLAPPVAELNRLAPGKVFAAVRIGEGLNGGEAFLPWTDPAKPPSVGMVEVTEGAVQLGSGTLAARTASMLSFLTTRLVQQGSSVWLDVTGMPSREGAALLEAWLEDVAGD